MIASLTLMFVIKAAVRDHQYPEYVHHTKSVDTVRRKV
jgi:hypothetical protein